MNEIHVVHPFEPIFDSRSRILVLGSLPSVLSRKNNFYYGNPQNRFWRVVAAVFSQPTPETIEDKTALLLRCGIALWDVVAQCDVVGSSDASIRNVTPTDLSRIFDAARVEAVFANGRTAAKYYEKYQMPLYGRPIVTLPSTSPANAPSLPLERQKRQEKNQKTLISQRFSLYKQPCLWYNILVAILVIFGGCYVYRFFQKQR